MGSVRAAHRLCRPAHTEYLIANQDRRMRNFFLTSVELVLVGAVFLASPPQAGAQAVKTPPPPAPAEEVNRGGDIFIQNCAFCHGRDAAGGEDGPDLVRSKLVADDKAGDKIGPVIRNGRLEHGMPRFSLSDAEIASVVAFIHYQKSLAGSQNGGRRGVDVADLQTGNAAEGKRYFNGPGRCISCHSPTGDLAGVATRYQGLALEQRLLYPKGAKANVTVTLPSGQTISGELAYRDEFVIGLRDGSGAYHSWLTSNVKYSIRAPADAHAELLDRYTDADIHNLMAYLQTLR
jgi:cytochrome c oxidase cbb3-type subunit III